MASQLSLVQINCMHVPGSTAKLAAHDFLVTWLQGEWHCADCVAGRPVTSRHAPRNPRLQFMASQLSLVRIDRMWRLRDGTVRFSGRWYCKPEDTVDGRQVIYPSYTCTPAWPGNSRLGFVSCALCRDVSSLAAIPQV